MSRKSLVPLQLPGDPTNVLEAAPKQYVDTAVTGLATQTYVNNRVDGVSWKTSVHMATTANITLSGLQTIDGITSAVGNVRVLVKNQTAPAENGIYVSNGSAWSRASDMDAATEVPGASVYVKAGTTQADTVWTVTSPDDTSAFTLGTTAMTWTQFGIGTEVDWSSSLVWNGAVAGAGSIKTAFYQRLGTWVDLSIYFMFGTSGVNGGTGDLSFNLPFSAAFEQVGTAKTWIPSAGVTYYGVCRASGSTLQPVFFVNQTDTYAFNWRSASAGAAVATGVPVVAGSYTVQNSGDITLSIRYKV